ncbi:class I SAM-dependent methyltransferase [Hathewaya histolytica]|uniref:Putative tRNA-m1A22 methylase n=1 Tax=Hathewaya histolytica TaxID=1498 RepID=A0A4U9RH60_HATHI|nr:class I SAM-dependent methyltransferase [Hathewaya histolytica]VTQ90538.1 putative tRNA-m1A22 methylase [Hathewaya histolytica]
MELSKRLYAIASFIENVDSIVDIGTDHAYIPIYLIKNDICKFAIAGDINIGPIEKAVKNIKREALDGKIATRLGGGFKVISKGEVQCAIIAGMGGDLIKDIIQCDLEKFKSLDYAVVQPVQNADVFRKYIYEKGFKIIDEQICYEEGKFYEVLKIKYAEDIIQVDPIYYEVSKFLLDKRDNTVKEYVEYLIKKYEEIASYIKSDTENSKKRCKELYLKISKLRSCLYDFDH